MKRKRARNSKTSKQTLSLHSNHPVTKRNKYEGPQTHAGNVPKKAPNERFKQGSVWK